MSDKPDLSELFQMLAEEKAKVAEKQEKKKKKSKDYQKDFMEVFSQELKKLKEEEEQQKRDIAAMEAWLTSPVVEKDEKPELEVEVADEPVAPTEEEIEAVEQVLEEDKETLEALAETPLQEQALQYLNDKREELSEEAKQIKSMKKEMTSFSEQLTKLRLLMQNMGGGGIVKLRQADDIDTSTALVNNKFLKYDSSTGKFVGADASGGGGGISNVVEDTTPQLGGNLDLNSNDITGTGDIDITGEITANEFIGEFRGPLIFKAQADGALSKGDVVFVSGISGNTPTVAKADANDATKMPAFGLAHDAASDNAAVDVVTFGTLSNLDTSSFTVGDTLYVSTTAGALTNSAPAGESSYIQNIGKVQRAHASAGSIKVGGAGRFNATGNLNDGNIFIGNSSNQASTASLETEVESLLGSVGVSIVPDTNETYNLGSSSLRWNELFLAGQTIDLGGTKISKDSNGDVELKDSSDNLKRIKVDEIEIGSGDNRIKLTKSSSGKLEIQDKDSSRKSGGGTDLTLTDLGITDGSNGQVLTTDGSGSFSFTTVSGGSGIALTDLSVGTENTASGNGAISYSNTTGEFKFTPPAVGDGFFSQNNFTNTLKSKLDGIEASADVTDTTNVVAALTAGTNVTIAADGTISSTDTNTTYTVGDGGLTQNNFTDALKTKLDGIEASADVTDSTNVVAALTAGTNITIAADGTISSTDTNTTYTVGDGGLTQNNFTDALKTKLDGIEASADVTDAANVTAAGALMDSEVTNLAQVKAFDSSDYATAAQGTLADSALQSVSESDVTAHQAALSITESQISDLGSYITNSVTNTSVSNPIMTFTTTEASSSAGPIIDLKRNSASPADGDYIGQLKFRGENDADQDVIYAKLTGKISDASDGTEDGLIEIAVKNGGSNRIVARFTGSELKLLNNAGIDVASGGTIDGELASTATATTASTGDNSTKIATTAFVQQEITALKALLYAYDQS